MNKELLQFLRSDRLRQIIDSLILELDGMGLSPRLVKQAGSRMSAAEQQWRSLLLDLVVGTQKARGLEKAHDGWFYTARMAEQATHPQISQHHAYRLGAHDRVFEICTGAGHDARSLAALSGHVHTVEADPVVAALATTNLERSGIMNVLVEARPWSPDFICEVHPDAIWADPARRDRAGSRTRSLIDHDPSPVSLLHWAATFQPKPVIGIKLGPADDTASIRDDACSREYIGFGRECREQVFWVDLDLPAVSVTLVDQEATWHPRSTRAPFPLESEIPAYLIEPHAAIIASGAVSSFFAEVDVQAIDPQIAYGITDVMPPESPFYQRFQVITIDQGISEKRIRRRLGELGWGSRTEFKKRGWPGDPESLRSLISDRDADRAGVVILVRKGRGHVTIYAERIGNAEHEGKKASM